MAALTCALAPAYTVRWQFGFFPTTLLELSILATVATFVVEARREGRMLEWRSPFTAPIVMLLFAGAISVLVPPDHRAALGLYRAYFIEPIAFFFVLAEAVRTPRRAALILAGLAIGAVFVAVLNAALVIGAIRRHTLDVTLAPPVAVYQSANSLALFLGPLIAMALSLVLYAANRWERLLSGAFLVISVPALLLTFSRGGYLALLAIGIGLALTHRRAKWLVPIALLAAIALTQVPLIKQRISLELQYVQGNTLDWRLRVWTQTLKMMKDHLLFGVGLSNFKQAMAPFWQDLTQVIYPHNIVLNFWTVTGVLGLVGFAWLFVRAANVSWRGWRAPDNAWRPFHLGVFLMLVAVLVHGLVDVPFFKNDLSFEFFVLLALTWAGTRWQARF